MKILAIRGRNLASLAGDFSLDLQAEPLASAGLFAITGPTGSGKTTLLDALSLALFDRTPRLAGRSSVQVGRADGERLGAADPRALLTRGAGSGRAEVDFVGRDGVVYTAIWSIHRARDRPDGALQDARLTLKQRDSGAIVAGGTSGSRRLARAAIVARLGLDFEQFRRSALLAQGEFAAFLRAQASDRSELLERLTGSEVYARLSIAAHGRRRLAAAGVAEIEEQLTQLGILGSEARQELQEELDAALHSRAVAQTALTEMQRAAAWFAELDTRTAETELGQAQLASATGSLEEAAPRRDVLATAERAERLRARWERCDRAARERVRAAEAAAQAVTAAAAAAAAAETVSMAALEMARAAEQARRSLDDAATSLTAARLADQRLAAARAVLDRSRGDERRAVAGAHDAHELLGALRGQLQHARSAVSSAAGWRERHDWLESVAVAWPHVDEQLRELRRRRADAQRLDADESASSDSVLAARQQLVEATAALSRAREDASGREAQVQRAELAVAALPRAALAERRRETMSMRSAAEQARDVAAAAARSSEAVRHQAGLVELAANDRAAALRAAEVAASAMLRHEVGLEEARRAWVSARDAFTEVHRRANLKPGEPCPLCGSPEHPWADGSPFDDGLATFEARVQELQTALDAAREAHRAAEASSKDAEKRHDDAELARGAAARTLETASLEWSGVRTTLGDRLPEAVGGDSAAAAAAAVLDDVVERLAAVERAEHELARLETAAAAARAHRDVARAGVDAAVLREQQHRGELEAATRSASDREAASRAARERSDTLRASLASLLALVPDVGSRLSDAEACRSGLHRDVERWTQEGERLATASAEQQGLVERVAMAQGDLERQNEAAASAHAESEQAEVAYKRAADARALILDGEAADVVERGLQEAARRAEAIRHAARDRLAAADAACERAEALSVERTERAAVAASEASEARLSLDAGLALEGIDEATVAAQCAVDVGWAAAERLALTELERQVGEARAVLAERRARLAAHLSTGVPEATRHEIEAAVARAQADLEQAEQAHRDLELARRRDEEARSRAAELSAELEGRAAAARVWQQLDALIGSAAGEKFRAFAQSLTLEALLVQANGHLRQLAPRYRLERVPGQDLALQVVDRDFGQEVRSVNSLSGGETFLASLALALGLASLSAVDTPVESLFIDEGLGTLDPETLDTALSALDALQASGRQIGIISHVESLSEHVAANVRVVKLGTGRSRVVVVSRVPPPRTA